jgi:hypothetical protein
MKYIHRLNELINIRQYLNNVVNDLYLAKEYINVARNMKKSIDDRIFKILSKEDLIKELDQCTEEEKYEDHI